MNEYPVWFARNMPKMRDGAEIVDFRAIWGGCSIGLFRALAGRWGRCFLAWPVRFAALLFRTECTEDDKATEATEGIHALRGFIFLGALGVK